MMSEMFDGAVVMSPPPGFGHADAVLATRKSIERGETVSGPLRETAVFPPMVVQMIAVGEATGALDTMLAKIADFYEEEVDVAVAGLLTLLEPVMIAFLGGAQNTNEECYLFQKAARLLGAVYVEHQARL